MRAIRRALDFAGRNGPVLLFAGVLVGLAMPRLAAAARPLMDVAVFFFTLGAFLKVDAAAMRGELEHARANAVVLAWTTFGVPLSVWLAIRAIGPHPDLAEGLLLCTLAPPLGSAAAIAAMLGLRPSLALLATVVGTVLSPWAMPRLASLLAGVQLTIDPVAMAWRLAIIVGGAATVAVAMRRWAGRFVAENPAAMTGIAVTALLVFALGAMRGMQAYFTEHPGVVAGTLALAFAMNAGFQAIGTVLFAACGRRRAATVGLVSGNRNVGLAWAAVGDGLAPLTELYFAMSVLPIYMLPAITRPLIVRWLAPRAAGGTGDVDDPDRQPMPSSGG